MEPGTPVSPSTIFGIPRSLKNLIIALWCRPYQSPRWLLIGLAGPRTFFCGNAGTGSDGFLLTFGGTRARKSKCLSFASNVDRASRIQAIQLIQRQAVPQDIQCHSLDIPRSNQAIPRNSQATLAKEVDIQDRAVDIPAKEVDTLDKEVDIRIRGNSRAILDNRLEMPPSNPVIQAKDLDILFSHPREVDILSLDLSQDTHLRLAEICLSSQASHPSNQDIHLSLQDIQAKPLEIPAKRPATHKQAVATQHLVADIRVSRVDIRPRVVDIQSREHHLFISWDRQEAEKQIRTIPAIPRTGIG